MESGAHWAADAGSEAGPELRVAVPIGMGADADADAASEPGVDLNALLLSHLGESVLLRVCGPSMQGAGIGDGALLLVERGAAALPGQIVVARLQGGFTVKRLQRHRGRWRLEAAHPAYPPLPLADGDGLWGVVRHVIQAL